MNTLWQEEGKKFNPLVERFTVGDDYLWDTDLVPFDVDASIAHAQMLKSVGLLNAEENTSLVAALEEIKVLHSQGNFKVRQSQEDCHTAIEQYLTEKLGETGKKIHTGRSRNDQVAVAMRLYSKHRLQIILNELSKLTREVFSFVKQHERVPMPGMTHTQPAMLSTVGLWAGSFVESLLDDAKLAQEALGHTNANPLGSAAGFGPPVFIDRLHTTAALGFERPVVNAIYCQVSRCKNSEIVVGALAHIMSTLARMANDMVWYTSAWFKFFELGDDMVTGSSIMPQKKNYDVLELVRARASMVYASLYALQSLGQKMMSGYNRDTQLTKVEVMKCFAAVESSMEIMKLVWEKLSVNHKQLTSACGPEIFATDRVYELVKKGMAFRDAYQEVKRHLNEVSKEDMEQALAARTTLGSPGNLGLEYYEILVDI
ncbi:MAG: Argininosuccinate lyase [Candidatus Magasanikbacteria bacterium GW2011_GWA2_45_39]|uniref:Argininosuccinate lyase n=1 Tax=Candidatus Magasanikbacteria bacterium GW2011_GWA2_45_39 TaxID=1619041 RepID=A0A0G1MHY9_9BACT|nr:MAG: Argininosuccinate lyase [Candidatus Magasanikbacteria bacterium GW2011_GWA2_45_39]HBW74234.1 argininosuccinate lyase [Candidatus Magasanikbacteria bacterium]